jgi:hypothetical protein
VKIMEGERQQEDDLLSFEIVIKIDSPLVEMTSH